MDTTCPDCGGEHSLDVSCANAKAGQIASLSADNERLRAAISEFKRITDAQGWCAEHMTEAVKNLFAALSPTAGREVVCVPKEPTPEMATYEEHEACFGPRTEGGK